MSEKQLKSTAKWTPQTAIEQLEKCGYECQGGGLKSNDAFLWLKEHVESGPEFYPGQVAWCEVFAEAHGMRLSAWVQYEITACRMASDTERRYWEYCLSDDPPNPWHCGENKIGWIRGDKLQLEKPETP